MSEFKIVCQDCGKPFEDHICPDIIYNQADYDELEKQNEELIKLAIDTLKKICIECMDEDFENFGEFSCSYDLCNSIKPFVSVLERIKQKPIEEILKGD